MFISDKFIYLELHKTGCSHIRKILSILLDGKLTGGHNQASSDLFNANRVFLGSVRDPWEWYTSLWAYGCDKKGGIYWQVTGSESKNPKEWLNTYNHVNDPVAFRAWLHMMHDAKYLPSIGEGYSICPVSRISGLMTFRYLKLFCTKLGEHKNLDQLLTFEQIKKYETDNCFIDYFIRNESLEPELFQVLERFGAKIPSNLKSEIISLPKSNVSSRKHGPRYYYETDTENLVAERERLIIDKFGYVAPSLRGAMA